MPRISEYTVIIDESVITWMAERYRKFYPLENGVFLFGDFWKESRHSIPHITQASEPLYTERTVNNWTFIHTEFVRQTKLAAADGRMILGWSHSHPWKTPPLNINIQSILDARIQIDYRLNISMIFGIWDESWWCTAWKEGFAAPLVILIHKDTGKNRGSLVTIKRWYYDTYKHRAWFLEKSRKKAN